MEFVCHFLGRTYWGPTVVVLPDVSKTQVYHQKHLEMSEDIWKKWTELSSFAEDTPIPVWTTLADAPWLDGKRFPSPRVQAWLGTSTVNMSAIVSRCRQTIIIFVVVTIIINNTHQQMIKR